MSAMLEEVTNMKLSHRAIKSPLFEMIKTYELDIDVGSPVGNEERFSLRIELFRSTSDKRVFRYKTWRTELFRIQSTFPQNEFGGHKHDPSDEMIWVEFSLPHFGSCEELIADNPEEALKKIIGNFSKALEHITSEGITIE
jgi:hypothetical protein